MDDQTNDNERAAKLGLVAVSLIAAAATYVVLQRLAILESPVLLFGAAIVVSLAYPLLAALAVYVCSLLRTWAHVNDLPDWDNPTRVWLGVIWPTLIIYCLVVCIFMAIINRLFPRVRK